MTTTKAEETHPLANLIRERHEAGTCITLCPVCTEEARATSDQANVAVFDIMPRNPHAKGLKFQAGLYSPRGGGHSLIGEFYDKRYALHAADLFTLMASPLFEGIEVNRKNTAAPAIYRINVKGY